MKVIKRDQAKDYSNSPTCNGFEFNLDDKNLDGAVVRVTGRYPETGRAVNQLCKEIAFIISGTGQVVINGEPFKINSDDLVVIDKGESYYWSGDFKLFVYCTPAWFSEQHGHLN
jgi:mannose-6-phosphate isomerase-like protein (cupin superfamily)